jgi:hypothetical protein
LAAARRAAAYLAFQAEPLLRTYAAQPAALDSFCALSAAVDRAAVSEAALAAASADLDEIIACAARALLHARALLRNAGAPAAPDGGEPPVPPDLAAAASLTDAVDRARSLGFARIEVPRELLRIIGMDPGPVLLLRAAFSNDDEALVRAMVSDFDVAELRAAVTLSAPRSLRAGLSTAGAAFRGGDARDRALAWAGRVREIRRCGRKKRGALAAAVASACPGDDALRSEAVAADAVWESVESVPPASMRVALLCDAVTAFRVDDRMELVPLGGIGVDGSALGLRFKDAEPSLIDVPSLARALEVDAALLEPARVTVSRKMHECAIEWLAGAQSSGEMLAWPVGEERRRVTSPAMTFSASRLNLYAKCPRRWFYEYLCEAVDEKTTSHAVYGKVFHAALEALHRDVRVPAQWQAAEVFDRLCASLDAAFGQAHREFASQLEYEVLRLRARQVAQHYVRWLYEEAADAPLEIVEIESRQSLLYGGHRFVGYIDRVDRPTGGGPVTIFDYKTGRIEEDPDEYLRSVRSGEEAQLALYYAMRRAQGDDVARIALVSIRDARDKTWILALDIADAAGVSVVQRAERAGVVRATCSIADLERSLDVLTARCDLLTRTGVDHFDVGADPPCNFCAYAHACRERPADGERIFAR